MLTICELNTIMKDRRLTDQIKTKTKPICCLQERFLKYEITEVENTRMDGFLVDDDNIGF